LRIARAGSRTRPPYRGEAAALLNAARTGRADTRLYLPLFLVLALYTGARKEAVLSLRWPQIDLDRRRINFNQPGRKRTAKGRAHIPIPDRLLTFLRLAKRRGSDLGFVVHLGGERIKDIGGAWDGNPERSGDGSFGRACKRAGLSDVTPHTLRHTCGTWLAQAGVPLFEIGGWLGHSHEHTVTLYAHHHPDYLETARKAADGRGQ
jgi:integrase